MSRTRPPARHHGPAADGVVRRFVVAFVAIMGMMVAGLVVVPAANAATSPVLGIATPFVNGVAATTISTTDSIAWQMSAGCAKINSGTYIHLVIDGGSAGHVWSAVDLNTPTKSGVSTTAPFTASQGDTFAGYQSGGGLPALSGVYTMTGYCQSSFGDVVSGTFVATITFAGTTGTVTFPPAITTTTALQVSPDGAAAAGASVTFTATVSPAVNGVVTFKDGSNVVGTASVTSGVATISRTTLALGSHSFTAAFGPTVTAAYVGSTSSPAIAYTISCNAHCPTQTTLSASPSGQVRRGQPATLTATVAPAAAGSVQFLDGATPLGNPVTVVSGSAQSAALTTLTEGSHSFTAQFTPAGGSIYAGSTSSATPYSVVVETTTVTLSVSPASSAIPNADVTITATVVSADPAPGTVQLSDNNSPLGSPLTVTNGSAHLVTSWPGVGSHLFTATFTSSDPGFHDASTASATPYSISNVVQQHPTLTLTKGIGSPASTALGQALPLTATLSIPEATGTVQFTDNGANIGDPVDVVSGAATFRAFGLALGSHSFSAVYVPTSSAAFAGTTAPPVSHTVIPVPKLGSLRIFLTVGEGTTGLDTDAISLETVSSGTPQGCRPLGTAQMQAGAVIDGPNAAWAGILAITPSRVSTGADFKKGLADTFAGLASSNSIAVVAGKYTITLQCLQAGDVTGIYTGNVWFTDATHWQTTDPNAGAVLTTTSVAAAPVGFSYVGSTVTLTATLSPSKAAGSVQFTNTVQGATAKIGAAVPVVNGVATLRISTLAVGLYTLGAKFTPADSNKYARSSEISTVPYYVRFSLPPTAKGKPVVTGARLVAGATVGCHNPGWSGATSVGYRWLRNGVALPGANHSTYRIASTDGGGLLACRVYGTNSGGSVSVTSDSRRVALGPASVVVNRPRIAGNAVVGHLLAVSPGVWSPAATSYVYQWRVNGAPIAGATGRFFRPTAAQRGKHVACTVGAQRPGMRIGYSTSTSVVVK